MIEMDKTTFELDFSNGLEDVPKSQRRSVLNEVGSFLVEEVLNYVGQGQSPVKGVKDFKKLNKTYADKEKMGDRLPNLDLNGSMMDSLTYKVIGNKVVVGIFDSDEAPKSHGHNTGGGNLPKRQFLPDDNKGETLKKDILQGISRIIEEYVDDTTNSDNEEE